MMVKATEYYNLEKVAEVLSVPTAEVNRLREQGKLRGFRDGSTWRFQKGEVHSYLAESIKARSGANGGNSPGDSDFELDGSASSSSFDVLMEEAALPDDSDLVSVSPTRPSSDLDLAALDQDDELSLAEETQISSLVVPKKAKPAVEPSSIIVQDDEDSSALLLAPAGEIDVLEDEASVLEAGSSPQLGLAGDSGFDVLVAGEEDEGILLVDEEKTEAVGFVAQEFELEPSPSMLDGDDSESSSQVIAIDAFAEVGQEADPFGRQDDAFDAFTGFDSDIHQAPAATTSSDPFGTGDALATPIAVVSPPKAAAPAEEYSTGMLIALVAAVFVMLFPGMMLIDNMTHMWSWNEPFILNSILMDTISGLFGL
jgi:excisionase family DNA binding protein